MRTTDADVLAVMGSVAGGEREVLETFLDVQRGVVRPVLPDPEVSFAVGEEETVAGLIAAYEAACARSRESPAGYPLGHVVPHEWLGQVSLRWILTHMIEETARHAGHADILRELTDGATGTVD